MKQPGYITRLLLAIVAFMVIDGHLAVTQLYAWASMIVDRTEERGFTAAVESTFSGAEPCDNCLRVQEERQQREENAPHFEKDPLHKLIASAQEEAFFHQPTPTFASRIREPLHVLQTYGAAPPTPPPDFFIL